MTSDIWVVLTGDVPVVWFVRDKRKYAQLSRGDLAEIQTHINKQFALPEIPEQFSVSVQYTEIEAVSQNDAVTLLEKCAGAYRYLLAQR